jgi:hypothetical protein
MSCNHEWYLRYKSSRDITQRDWICRNCGMEGEDDDVDVALEWLYNEAREWKEKAIACAREAGHLQVTVVDRECERDGLIVACENLLQLVREFQNGGGEDFIDRERLGLLDVEFDARTAIERARNRSGCYVAQHALNRWMRELYHTALAQLEEARDLAQHFAGMRCP